MAAILFLVCCAVVMATRIVVAAARRDDAYLGAIVALGVTLRLSIGVINHYFGPLPGAEVDAIVYVGYAQHIAYVFGTTNEFILEWGRLGYSSLLALFDIAVGFHWGLAPTINAFFSVEFLLLVYGIGLHWGDRRSARQLTTLAALYPTALLYTGVPLREAQLMWGFALYVTGLIAYYERRASVLDWRIWFGLTFTVWLHDGFAPAIAMVVIAAWYRHSDRPAWQRLAVLGLAGVAALVAFASLGSVFRKLPNDPLLLLDPRFLAGIREWKASYGTGYGQIEPTWPGIFKAIPVILYAFLGAPFPAWMHGAGDVPKAMEGVFCVGLTAYAFLLLRRRTDALTRGRLWFLGSCYAFMWLLFAIGTGNVGIAIRHRAKLIWLPAVMVVTAAAATRRARSGAEPTLVPSTPHADA